MPWNSSSFSSFPRSMKSFPSNRRFRVVEFLSISGGWPVERCGEIRVGKSAARCGFSEPPRRIRFRCGKAGFTREKSSVIRRNHPGGEGAFPGGIRP